MAYIRLLAGIIVGLFVTSIIAEVIELGLVLAVSDEAFSDLRNDQERYFEIRNHPGILASKLAYTLLAAVVGGWLAAKVAGRMSTPATYGMICVQTAALCWAGFLSELGATAPQWLWFALIVITSAGFYLGYLIATARQSGKTEV